MEKYTVGSAVRQMSVHMANLYYYITKEMVATFGIEASREALEKAMMAFGRARGAAIAEKVKAAGEALTIENLDKYYDIPIAEGWDLHRTYAEGRKDNTTDSCTFADVWIDKDWREVGHIYCLVDIAIREGYSQGLPEGERVVFNPGKNIIKGDNCCTSVTVYE